jgi:polyferredoxin
MVFVTLAIIGWGHFVPEYVNDKLYAKTNIVNLVIWGLWWPMMVWVAVLFGRIWCTVCPLELITNGTERLGRKFGVKQLILGKWLRSGVLITVLYATIQLCVAGAHLHRIPAYTSLFLCSLLGAAGLVVSFLRIGHFVAGFAL